MFSLLIGLSPCFPIKKYVLNFYVKVFNCCYQLFMIVIILYRFHELTLYQKNSDNLTQRILDFLSLWLIPCGLISYIITAAAKQNQGRLILQKIEDTDDCFKKLGSTINYRKLFYFSWISLLISISGGLYIFLMYKSKFKPLDRFFRSISVTFRVTAECQFALLMWICYKNYKKLNDILRKMDLNKATIFEQDFTLTPRRCLNINDDLKAIARIHHDIYNTIKLINSYYSLDILLIFILNFSLLIALLHNSFVAKISGIRLVVTIGSIIRLGAETFVLIGICYITDKEVN